MKQRTSLNESLFHPLFLGNSNRVKQNKIESFERETSGPDFPSKKACFSLFGTSNKPSLTKVFLDGA